MKKTIACIIATAVLLSACHKNPLKTETKDKTARFLVAASRYAEKQMHHNDMRASGYLVCMQGNKAKIDCDQLFAYMKAYAKTQTDFASLEIPDLKDAVFFKKIAARYEERKFFVID